MGFIFIFVYSHLPVFENNKGLIRDEFILECLHSFNLNNYLNLMFKGV